MGFLRRRAERREIRRRAVDLQPSVAALHDEIEAAARRVRDEFHDLPGYPPICERCDRIMIYERVQLTRKKWRWMWVCRRCGRHTYDATIRTTAASG